MIKNSLIFVLFAFLFFSCSNQKLVVKSPDNKIAVSFKLSDIGEPVYSVSFNNNSIIGESKLGFDFKNLNDFKKDFRIKSYAIKKVNETWQRPWGESKEVKNHYHLLTINLQENKTQRELNLYFKVYNSGIGFRYEVPKQKGIDEIIINNEKTEFQLLDNHTAWWIPGDWDSYEHLYTKSKVSEIDATEYIKNASIACTSIKDKHAVNTPVTFKTNKGVYLSFHEANLTNYSGMTLNVNNKTFKLTSALVGGAKGYAVKTKAPFVTPWRTIQISKDAAGLISSNLIVNLNEPNKIKNTDWIEPSKYMGIWWEMHLGKSSWDMASGKHGATTENAIRFIDFASNNNIKGLLIEGWNTGWEKWLAADRDDVFDFITPYKDFDLKKVYSYAKKKGVNIIGHHETSGAVTTYLKHIDKAFKFCKENNINMIKTGYVGSITPKGEYHHGQYMVNHYREVIKKAAEMEIMIDAHEPIKATGIRRTYPNFMAREGVRGQEFNAWGNPGNNPAHTLIIPFTRILGGPIDFTPGIFNIKFNEYKKNNQVPTTLAKQLALYITLYSPIQMAADLPEHYANKPEFQFIRDVAVDWEKSIVLNAEIGEYLTIARKQKDSENWFIGSTTNQESRNFKIKLDFLNKALKYKALLYADGKNAHWDKNPLSTKISELKVDSNTILDIELAPGGGQAISIMPIK